MKVPKLTPAHTFSMHDGDHLQPQHPEHNLVWSISGMKSRCTALISRDNLLPIYSSLFVVVVVFPLTHLYCLPGSNIASLDLSIVH